MEKEITRNDFSYFQNEILKDMKTMENRINEKISNISKNFKNATLIIEQKYQSFKLKIDKINKTLESNNIIEEMNNKLDKFNSKLEETTMTNNTKIASFEKDLSNACYKYDKIFLNNISSPGLIGDGCPYATMRAFLEFVNNRIKEFLSSKDKSIVDFKRHETWVKTTLDKFKEEIVINKNEIYQYLNKEIKQYDKRSIEKMNIVEDKLSFIKIENGRYNYNLHKKWEELEEKLKLFNTMNDNLINHYNNCKIEYLQIKNKFNDLSKYFKDIKLSKNTNYKTIFDDLSKKINMNINKKQKQNSTESNKYSNVLPSISSIDDLSRIQINKKDNNDNCKQSFNVEVKMNRSKLLKKKTFQIETFGSSFNLKKSFNTNNNLITNIGNLNILSENNSNKKKSKFNFERKLTQNYDFPKSNLKTYTNNFINEEKKLSDSLILKTNKSVNENKNNNNNNVIINNIEEENKENSSFNTSINNSKNNETKEKENEKEKEEEEEKEKEEENLKNKSINKNNDDIIKEIEMHSSISKSNLATIDQKIITSIGKKNEMNNNNISNDNINNNNNKILNNQDINSLNNSKIVTKLNLDEELNKINQKFDDLYDKANAKILEITHHINILIKSINKIIFKREDNIKKINEIDFFVERKKKNIFLSNSGVCLPFSNNKNINHNLNNIKKDSSEIDYSFNIINKMNKSRNIYNNKFIFHNIKANRTKLAESRANSNDINNLIKDKDINKNKNFYIRMIDTKSINKIESYLIKKFSEPI